ERTKQLVARRADEHEPAGRDRRPGAAAAADALLALGQLTAEPERHGPDDLAAIRIDGHELGPRRPIARRGRADAAAVLVVAAQRRREARIGPGPADARAVVTLIRALRAAAVVAARHF